jgi:Spy/CpxP family protein refolding chaperone
MKLTRIAVTAAMMLTMSAAAVVAQTATTPVTTPERPAVTGKSIQQRKVNQQDRIAQGVKSGRLNAG